MYLYVSASAFINNNIEYTRVREESGREKRANRFVRALARCSASDERYFGWEPWL